MSLPALPADADHRVAERTLRDAGWTWIGAGDWAIVLSSPSEPVVARISPFDPAAAYTAELYRRCADTGQVPALHEHLDLEGGATCTVMELLQPASAEAAAAFLAQVTDPDPAHQTLAAAVRDVHADAQRELPWCGPVDTNPSNAMARADGTLVLIDPFGLDGPVLYGTLGRDPMAVARVIPQERRRHLLELPLAHSGPWDEVERTRMRAGLAAADVELGR